MPDSLCLHPNSSGGGGSADPENADASNSEAETEAAEAEAEEVEAEGEALTLLSQDEVSEGVVDDASNAGIINGALTSEWKPTEFAPGQLQLHFQKHVKNGA